MKQTCRALAVLISLAIPAAFCAEQPAAVETVGEFVSRIPIEDTEPFIQYCKAALPEAEMVLSLEYEQYKGRAEEAGLVFRRKMAKHAFMNQPVPVDIATDSRQRDALRLTEAKAEDPEIYCATLRETVASRTVEFLSKRLEGIFVRLETLNDLNKQLKKYGVKPAPQ